MARNKLNTVLTIREQIAEQLRSDIISGVLAPTSKMNEQALADRFGVSRGPIRDVLIQLTKEGLLVSKNNCGASVNDILATDIQKLMVALRVKIETFAIEKLTNNMTQEDFDALDEILVRLEVAFNAQDFTTVTTTDIEFHAYLIKKAGGDELYNVWCPIVMRMRLNYVRITHTEECINEHRAILNALMAHDFKEAARALKTNIK